MHRKQKQWNDGYWTVYSQLNVIKKDQNVNLRLVRYQIDKINRARNKNTPNIFIIFFILTIVYIVINFYVIFKDVNTHSSNILF